MTGCGLGKRVVGSVVLASLCGCAGFFPPLTTTTPTTPATATGNYIYVANTTGSVAAFRVSTMTTGVGQLTAVSGSPFALGLVPTAMTITPTNSFLYVAEVGAIYAYSIASGTGVLTLANGSNPVAVTLTYPAASLDVSPDGQWLFALSQDGVTLSEYQINATTGSLALQNAVQYTAANGAAVLPKMVKVAPNGVYVALALGTGGDVLYGFNTTTGVLGTGYQTVTGSATASDNALAIDSTATYLYVARSGSSGGVAIYPISANGQIVNVASSVVPTGAGPFGVKLDATGKFLYVANRTDATISGFSVGTGGALTALGGSPYVSGSAVASLARDSSGKYLFAAAGGSPDLTMYGFDATVAGKLDELTSTATGSDPTGPIVVVATH